ncbi:heavy metal-responsive transcriptional regulator [Gordonia sp. AC31]|uniref:heavy metal-responsive transcriptional regulator n=1 Tax=Gordonia TaxID=2053 RepID=UPI0028812135|nr:heavy metal-responsive transcriptional regulator [Gordonia sp. AC31]MDT0221641.1 heavy metal-responsive transcriptional regulator [Gordonia sp. AC31]
MGTYRISELAERTGVPASTLRYYEDAGLLTPERTPSGYRVYDDSAVDRLGFIASAKAMGMSLDEIRDLLRTWQTGACAEVRTQLSPMVDQRLAETEQRMAELTAFVHRLQTVRSGLAGPAPEGACGPGCGCAIADEPAAAAPPGTHDLGLIAVSGSASAVIACSLGPDELGDRARQWHDLLDTATQRQVADADALTVGVRYTFPGGPEVVSALAELVALEQQCCPFYTFTLHTAASETSLEVRAPRDAQPLLEDLFGAIPTSLG